MTEPNLNLPRPISAEDAELYDRCVQFVLENRNADPMRLQQTFGLSYAKTMILLDGMEENGILGPYEGARKPRKILIEKH